MNPKSALASTRREALLGGGALGLGALALSGGAQAAPARAAAPDLDAIAAAAMRAFGTPGLSIALVAPGAAPIVKGYGVRRLGDAAPVDAATVFAIASNSKAFTAAALALLVDEGRLGWDDPVGNHLPDFRMYDAYVSQQLTVADLLTHRSGLGLGRGTCCSGPAAGAARRRSCGNCAISSPRPVSAPTSPMTMSSISRPAN